MYQEEIIRKSLNNFEENIRWQLQKYTSNFVVISVLNHSFLFLFRRKKLE